MKLSTSIGILLLGCMLVPPVLAWHIGQQTTPPLNQQYPGPNGHANFRKVVSGEFTGNLSTDIVFMDYDPDTGTSEPKLDISIEYLETSIGTGFTANDIAVLSGVVPGKDLLVTVEPGGLKLYQRMSATSSWNITTLFDGNSVWGNAAFVAVGDVNGDGKKDIIGVPVNKRDVLVALNNGANAWPTTTTITCPAQTINQLLLLNYTNTNDQANADDIAMMSSLGWGIIDETGVWRAWNSYTLTPLYACRMKMPTGTDRLITRTVFGGTDRLTINSESGTEGPYNLGAIGIVGMDTCDVKTPYGPDGKADLILTDNTSLDLKIYESKYPNAQTFDFTSTPIKFKYGSQYRTPAKQKGGFALADFDHDGRQDIAAPGQGDPNPNQTGVYSSITLVRPDFGYGMYQTWVDDPRLIASTNPGVLPDKIRLTIHPPSTYLQPGSGQSLGELVQIYYSSQLGAGPTLTPYAIVHTPVPASQGFQYLIFDLPLGFSLATSTGIFSIVAFQEVTDSNGLMVDRGPAFTGMLNPDPNLPVTNTTKDTTLWYGCQKEHDDVPTPGAWDVGPTVPPVPADDEPQEATG